MQDFRQLASLYAKHYGPFEWKREVQKFDLLEIGTWLDRVSRAKDDLEFYDICIEYVSSLNDAHSGFSLTSDFTASLGFTVDLWDNTIIVDSVNRGRLPAASYPIAIGDELISVDGVPTETLIRSLAKYATAANNRSTVRQAAAFITSRPQTLIPRAAELGDEAVVVVKSVAGEEKTLNIPWVKSGTPLMGAGPVPSPKGNDVRASRRGLPSPLFADDPAYMAPIRMLQNAAIPVAPATVLGMGSRSPVFAMPSGFVQRLGRLSNDVFFSGTYESEGVKLGFIRIPNYSPASQATALQQFEREITYFQANTDGLIIDDTRNPGGNACYLESLMSYVMPQTFRTIGYQLRATNMWIYAISQALTQARAVGAPPETIALVEGLLNHIQEANAKERGITPPIPICQLTLDLEPARDRQGNLLAYTKPVMVLADDFSASGGDVFPAIFQDNKRGPVLGFRTMGAGGTVVEYSDVGVFGEGYASVTTSIMNRKENVSTDDFRPVPYIENVGVRPDITVDYQTRDNLMNSGRPFVEAFTWFMVQHVNANR